MYSVFREMYTRYWCRLGVISDCPGTLLPLCKLFEDLVFRHARSRVCAPRVAYPPPPPPPACRYAPGVCEHLLSLGVAPLRIAFPWIRYAFSGYLEIREVLLLWDRVIGFDCLELLPVLSAAIVVFRAQSVRQATRAEQIACVAARGSARGVVHERGGPPRTTRALRSEIFAEASNLRVVVLLQYFLFAETPP